MATHGPAHSARCQLEAVPQTRSLAAQPVHQRWPVSNQRLVGDLHTIVATARFIAGGIDSVISSRLASGKALSIWSLLPELMHFVVLPYFGPQAALADFCLVTLNLNEFMFLD